MYHYLLVFLDPKENYKILGYQAFFGNSIINPHDAIPESERLELKLSGYLPDSSVNSKYNLLGSSTYDVSNSTLLIEFSEGMGGVEVEVVRYDGHDSLSIDAEISKILAVKRQNVFQIVGLFKDDKDFSVIGYVTYFGSLFKDPDNAVELSEKCLIHLDNFGADASTYQSKYPRLGCHYDLESKQLSIDIPKDIPNGAYYCQVADYSSPKENIDEIVNDLREQVMWNVFVASM